MKQTIQLIFASLLLAAASISFSACDGEDWEPDGEAILTDAAHGSLKNENVVATGDVKNVTHNSATILFSANYNYKELLNIKPVILYSDKYETSGYQYRLDGDDYYASQIKITSFTKSACEVTLSNLKPNTTYYYRVHADTGIWDHYGEVKSFTTSFDNTAGEAVDLGLSVKWASKNVGASQPEDKGDTFYWGGTEPCDNIFKADWHDYSFATMKNQGYIDSNGNLCPSHDAATKIWGSRWRMPTRKECIELREKCSWKRTTKNGMSVYLITGPNSNVIYIPVYKHWTSDMFTSSSAYHLAPEMYVNSHIEYIVEHDNLSKNFPIRPVMK